MACAGLGLMHVVGQGGVAWALGRLPASVTAVTILIQPVVAALLGWWIFAEALTPVQAIGGVLVLTVKNTLWDGGFSDRIAELEGQGVLTRVEETEPYVSMPGETGTVPSRGLVLRRS